MISLNKQIALFIFLISAIAPNLQGQNCSQEELEYLAQNAALVQELSQDCAFDCVLSGDQNQCVIDCLAAQLEVSEACLSCNAIQVQCVLDNCAFACLFPESQNCLNCIENNCMDDYFICIGDEDRDGFTEAGGDCNDQDPLINPLAEEISGDGIDQNCDGLDLITGIEEINALENWRPGQPLPERVSRMDCYSLGGRLLTSSFQRLQDLQRGIYIIALQGRNGQSFQLKWYKP